MKPVLPWQICMPGSPRVRTLQRFSRQGSSPCKYAWMTRGWRAFTSMARVWSRPGNFSDCVLIPSRLCLFSLEIGAGIGATTEAMLQGLVAEDGRRVYPKYVFTDISSGLFVLARDKFAKWDGVQYQVLDIESDPTAQGFELQSFDLIVASNVGQTMLKNEEALASLTWLTGTARDI